MILLKKMRFLGYIVSYQDIQTNKKQIKIIYYWLKIQLVYDI